MRQFSGLQYQYIDLANHLGHDRTDWDTRLEIGQDTYHSTSRDSIINSAKYPILARKAVRAINLTHKKQPCNIPVMFDATASGLQILAVLTGCERTAMHTNLINTNDRQCAYQNMSEAMTDLGYPIDRDGIKPATMTFFYASQAEPEKIFGRGTLALELFYQTLYEELPGATQAMYEMLAWWNNKATFHRWELPDGHVAHVPVMETFETKIESKKLDATFTYQFSENTVSTYNRPLPANVVQSVDGYVVRELRRRCGFPILPIHDCFGVHPNHVNKLRYHYLAIFRELAESNLFETIGRQCSGKYMKFRKHNLKLSSLMNDAEYHLS